VAADEAATKHRGGGASPYRGGSRDMRVRASPPPSAGSWLHIYLILTLGPGAIIQGRGDEEPKGTEEARRNMQRSDRGDFVAVRPRGACEELEGGFHLRFPSSRRGLRSFTSIYTHTHRSWGSIGSRNTTKIGAAGGGSRTRS
jgi:hypothetical protein